MEIELQGEGSYEYRCKKKDCWYCDMMFSIEQNIQAVEQEKEIEKIMIMEMYDHVLKKSKTVIPQVKPLTVKTMYSTFRLINTK